MNQRAKVIIGALIVIVLIMGATLAVAVSRNNNNATGVREQEHMHGGDAYTAMMQAMGEMNADAMLAHMREVLGEDGYRRMLEHWRNHRAGAPMADSAGVDEMMHQMMDAMMQRMPPDRDHTLPLPAASPAATPVR